MAELLVKINEAKAKERQILADTFPNTGKVRVNQLAAFLGIGVSSVWKMVSDKRIDPPQKLGSRTSVWNAEYVHMLSKEGIPEKEASQ